MSQAALSWPLTRSQRIWNAANEPIDWRVGGLPGALSDFEDNTFYACLCDPPYGLSDPPPTDVLLKWLAGVEVAHGKGFLGAAWDSLPPGPAFWLELYRVLRPGAIVMAFSHSRTSDLQTMAMRMAGLEILPAFAWLHAESQALGADVGKLIDKAAGAEREVVGSKIGQPGISGDGSNRQKGVFGKISPRMIDSTSGTDITAPSTPLAQLFDGHHSRLRGNWEPITVAMKPLDGTWAQNAERWECGGFNADAGRVPTVSGEDDALYAGSHATAAQCGQPKSLGDLTQGDRKRDGVNGYSPDGRFPSGVLISHSVECEVGACVPWCPAAVLAEQSGELRSGWTNGGKAGGRCYGGREEYLPSSTYDQGGTADRFYYQARPGRRERSAGCEGLFWQRDPTHPDGWRIVEDASGSDFEGNPHSCLKSLELTRYLAKLLRQPGDAQLIVPFSGSGSEAIGAMLGGWRHVTAIEGSAQHVETSKRREAFWRRIMDRGAVGSIRDLLGEHAVKAKKPTDRQGELFGSP